MNTDSDPARWVAGDERAVLRVAVWDEAELDVLAGHLSAEGAAVEVAVERFPRSECRARLLAGLADVALVPSVSALSDPGQFDIFPAVAISSWCTRTARIVLRRGLGHRAESMACDAGYAQEALVARIVLREHYGMEPTTRAVDRASHAGLLASRDDAVLLAGDPPESLDAEGTVLDLGREWFEFTNYPMVWGLFVARKGEADPRIVPLLRAAVADVESDAPPLDEIEEMIEDCDLRYRLDDVATASLTELCDLLFYYRVTDEIPAVAFASDPDAGGSDDDDEPPIEI